MVQGQLPLRKIVPRIIPPGQLPPRITAPEENRPPPRIIAQDSLRENSPKDKLHPRLKLLKKEEQVEYGIIKQICLCFRNR